MPFLLSILHHWLAWLIALPWLAHALATARGLPTVPNLLLPAHDLQPAGNPTLTVIVPAKNESANVAVCLQSLLAQDYPHLQILAVNDRSTDTTGEIMDTLALANPGKLRVLHIRNLPAGWLGKSHAMHVAASTSTSDFLLFTDADILFAPSALRLALANAQATQADHLVLMPTTIIRRWDEAAVLSFFSILGLWAARPWRIADPRAVRDAIGIGAFNLIRRTAYQALGGFAAFPMEIVEDIGLGRRVKQAGLRQRVAFGRDLVSVHWAAGAHGLIGVMTKNLFSIVNFRVALVLLVCLWLALFNIAPYLAIFFPGYTLPAVITLASIASTYHLMGQRSGLGVRNALLTPFAAAVFIYAMLRSAFITLRQGGVLWRGTFYSLPELRRHTAPLLPRRR